MQSDDLELVSLLLMDVRATVESMRRSVTNAQAGVERLRHALDDPDVLKDLQACLDALAKEAAIVTESVQTARPHVKTPDPLP